MRMLLKATIPVEAGNQALADGSMQKVLENVMGQLKPEASYFGIEKGQRAAYIVFDLAKNSDVVPMIEPLWMGMKADIELTPLMNLDDLMAGLQSLPR
jgi:hypothetical protein